MVIYKCPKATCQYEQDIPKKADNTATIKETVYDEEKTPPNGPQEHPQDEETQQTQNNSTPQEPTITLNGLM